MKTTKFFERCRTFTILCHKGPDVDTAGSAVALAEALEGMGKEVVMHAEPPIGDQAKQFLSYVNRSFSQPNYDADCIIVVDTNSPTLVDFESVKKAKGRKALIDHHAARDGIAKDFDDVFIDESSVSTTQIIYNLLKGWGVKPTRKAALAIAAGMVTDSAGFSIANNAFFSDLTEVLVGASVDFQEVLSSISVPVGPSEKIAKLKGAQRLEFIREGEYIIATSHVSSFESSVAKALVHMGADAAFVGAAKEGEIRISGRAQRSLVGKGYHLGRDILPAVAPLIQGDAGGHAGAAGANGVDASKLEAAMALCVQRTREFIKSLNITSAHNGADDIVREGAPQEEAGEEADPGKAGCR